MDVKKVQSDIKTYLDYNSYTEKKEDGFECDSVVVPFGRSKNAAAHAAKELRKALHGDYAIIRFSSGVTEYVRVKDHAVKSKKK